jgi:hypothetical protein
MDDEAFLITFFIPSGAHITSLSKAMQVQGYRFRKMWAENRPLAWCDFRATLFSGS